MIVLAATTIISPWIYWLATVRRNTQVGLLKSGGLPSRIASQALFYARRIPDALSAPFVELATVFSRSRVIGTVATIMALIFSAGLLYGLIGCAIDPRRRLAGLVPLVTLPFLLVWPFTEAGRFLIPLVPFLLVGVVEEMAWILGLSLDAPPHPDPPPPGGMGSDFRTVSLWVLLMAIPYPAYALLTRRADAQQRSHADFDAACAWIAREAKQHGPILTRHPGEVFWQTGRLAISPGSDDLKSLLDQIQDDKIAYILVDSDRFAKAPPTPLARLVAEQPEKVRQVFGGKIQVYEVTRDNGP